jgi:hypothetical protein
MGLSVGTFGIGGERISGNFGEMWMLLVSNSLMFREDV